MELHHVLARVAAGRLHDGDQNFVDALASVGRAQLAVMQRMGLVVADRPASGADEDRRGDV
jgi:hypothetical protein